MRTRTKRRAYFYLSLIITLITLSCAGPQPKGRTPAETLYRQAQDLMDNQRYIMAIERLNSLRSRYPYSYYATLAELAIADIYFSQENYVEAAAAYILFRDFHPKHKKMAYIISQIAESFFRQAPSTHDRDLSAIHQAIKYYQEVAQRYAASPYAEPAQKKMAQGQMMLDKKERYVADFYFDTKVYAAARYRYLAMLKTVKSQDMRIHAIERVVESSYHLKEYSKCISYIDSYLPQLNQALRSRLKKFKQNCHEKKSLKPTQQS